VTTDMTLHLQSVDLEICIVNQERVNEAIGALRYIRLDIYLAMFMHLVLLHVHRLHTQQASSMRDAMLP
jgi:hypothetical protein